MISIEAGLVIIRNLQPQVRPLGYHIALGGGVLNNGSSTHDLDLYFIPLVAQETYQIDALYELLFTTWGPGEPINTYPDEGSIYERRMRYHVMDFGYVEAFIFREPAKPMIPEAAE